MFFSRTRKRILKWAGALLGLLALLAAAAFLFPQQVLCVDDGRVQADVLIVPGGAGGERTRHAAELYRQGFAPRIILSGAGDCEGHRAILLAAGVPDSAITLENKSATTKENAEFTARILRETGVKRAAVVTSWWHSRRALNCFRHYAPAVRFYSCPSYYAYGRSEWVKAGIRPFIRSEYPKLAGYWVRYGIAPF